MNKLVNLSDEVYERLTRMKRNKNQSYSQVVQELIDRRDNCKTYTTEDLIAWAEKRAKKDKKKE